MKLGKYKTPWIEEINEHQLDDSGVEIPYRLEAKVHNVLLLSLTKS